MGCYAGIRHFERETLVDTGVVMDNRPGIAARNFTSHPKIYLYSHTAKQKMAGFTLIALGTITVIVGACLASPAASWGMIGAGTGTIIITISVMTTKHLLFAKQVSQFLVTQRDAQEWIPDANYPEFGPPQRFAHPMGDKTIYGMRYTTLSFGMITYNIEFHAVQGMR